MLVSSICVCMGQLLWKLSAEQGIVIMLVGFCFYGVGALIMIIAYRFGMLRRSCLSFSEESLWFRGSHCEKRPYKARYREVGK